MTVFPRGKVSKHQNASCTSISKEELRGQIGSLQPQAPVVHSTLKLTFLEKMLHHLNSEQQISWKKGYEIIHFFVGEKIKEKKNVKVHRKISLRSQSLRVEKLFRNLWSAGSGETD